MAGQHDGALGRIAQALNELIAQNSRPRRDPPDGRLRDEEAKPSGAQDDVLYEHEQRERLMLACIADGVIGTDAQGCVRFINPIAEDLTGWSEADALRRPLAEVVDLGETGNGLAEGVLREGQGLQVARDALLRRRDGAHRYVDYSVAPMHDRAEAVVGALLILRDNTRRREAELERDRGLALEQAARRQAEEAVRLKDEFLALVSHELRTPLHAILGWTHLLRQSAAAPQQRRALDAIYKSAMAQRTLIEELLEMSRIARGDAACGREPLQIGTVVAAAVDAARAPAEEKRLSLDLRLDGGEAFVLGDAAKLEQALGHLLRNAVKFTPPEGSIEVRVDADPQSVRVRVSDTGAGIAPEFMPHLFDAFRQADSSTRRRHGGLGLGLAIAQHAAALHGGRIVAESRGVGQGSAFTLSLPLLHGVEGMPARRDAAAVEPQGRLDGVRVLLVDDEADTRQMVGAILRQWGIEVREAGSAREALEAMRFWRPGLLVSDICMPDEDGYELLRRVRALPASQGGSLPAIALTALAREDDIERARAAGFDCHLTKPVMAEALARAIMQLGAPRGHAEQRRSGSVAEK